MISHDFPIFVAGFPMDFPWFSGFSHLFHGFPMIFPFFPWFSHGFPMDFPWLSGFFGFPKAGKTGGPKSSCVARGGVFPLAVLGQILMSCTCHGKNHGKTMEKMGKPWDNPWFWCFRTRFFSPFCLRRSEKHMLFVTLPCFHMFSNWLSHVETQHWSILWAIFWWKSSRILEMEVFSCEILMDKWGIFWRGSWWADGDWKPHSECPQKDVGTKSPWVAFLKALKKRPKGYVVFLTSNELKQQIGSTFTMLRIAPKWPEVEDFTWFHSPILQENTEVSTNGGFPKSSKSFDHDYHDLVLKQLWVTTGDPPFSLGKPSWIFLRYCLTSKFSSELIFFYSRGESLGQDWTISWDNLMGFHLGYS